MEKSPLPAAGGALPQAPKPFLRVVAPEGSFVSSSGAAAASNDDPNLPLSDRMLILAEREYVVLDWSTGLTNEERFRRTEGRYCEISGLMCDSVARSLAGLNAKGQFLKRAMAQAKYDIYEQIILSIIDDIARLLEEEKAKACRR
jgi:hypothetical protein